MHIPGCGDFAIDSITTLPDPCPFAEEKRTKQRLSAKERLMYAPMSNVGEMLYDKDGIYIQISEHKLNFTDPSQHRMLKLFVYSIFDFGCRRARASSETKLRTRRADGS